MTPATQQHVEDEVHDAVYAYYEPEPALKVLIGNIDLMSDVFTRERIAACQKIVDDAKGSFFDTIARDVRLMGEVLKADDLGDNYQKLYDRIPGPASNIKGQADLFGFTLVSQVCKYLLEYCEKTLPMKPIPSRNIYIIAKLVEVLQKVHRYRILDTSHDIEKDLVSILEQARR